MWEHNVYFLNYQTGIITSSYSSIISNNFKNSFIIMIEHYDIIQEHKNEKRFTNMLESIRSFTSYSNQMYTIQMHLDLSNFMWCLYSEVINVIV